MARKVPRRRRSEFCPAHHGGRCRALALLPALPARFAPRPPLLPPGRAQEAVHRGRFQPDRGVAAMPLKLVPPQEGRSPNWRIRGTYLGTYVDRSAGTARKELAAKELARLRVEIECGRYAPTSGPTFLEAAHLYLRSGK